jgi:hypothetical protein
MERGVTGAEFAGAMDVKDIAPTNESAAAILIVLIVSLLNLHFKVLCFQLAISAFVARHLKKMRAVGTKAVCAFS